VTLNVEGLCPLLQVYDMPTAVRFYRDTLGFAVIATSPVLGEDRFHWCWLRLGGAEVMLNSAYESDADRPVSEDPARVLGHGDTCLYLACPDVDAAYATLRAAGVEVSPPHVAPYGMKQLSLRDPDGYALCFQWQT
jgi:glyoxylase I family protein